MRTRADDWASMAAELDTISAEASSLQAEFGVVAASQSGHDQLKSASSSWSASGGAEAASIRTKLTNAASSFEDREASNTALSNKVI